MPDSPVYEFNPYRLVPGQRELVRDGTSVKLGGRAFDVLVSLVERRDRTVSKNELMDLVWPTVVVEENNLEVQIVALRKLLGHAAIATVPGRGYRFTLPVVEKGAPIESVAPEVPAEVSGSVGANTNLPSWLPVLIGREADLPALLDLIDRHSLVTVTGPGGSGKTRLGQTAAAKRAEEQTNGVWWVDLAALSDAAFVPHAVSLAMGLRLEDERDVVRAISAALRPASSLLVLDNAEHLRQAVSDLVVRLRAASPDVRILVTSQEVLHLTDEHVYRLEPLSLPDDDDPEHIAASGAVRLFVARAQAADRRFVLDADNRGAVVDICRRLDGIPLALELAAARVPLLGIDGLRQKLENRLQILTSGDRSALRRHQTLRAALEWSYQLLAPSEQAVFRRLGVFAGGFTLEAAQQVAADAVQIDSWDALEHLGGLVDKSLVVAEGDPVPRYRMLDTTRLFALERLIENGEASASRNRHRDHFLEVAEDANEKLDAADPRGLASFDRERDNLFLALAWSEGDDDGSRGLRLAAASRYFWTTRGLVERGLQVMLDALARPTAQTASLLRCYVLGAAAHLSLFRGRWVDALELFASAVEMTRSLGDERRLCLMLSSTGFAHLRIGHIEAATRCAEEALEIGRQLGDSHELGSAITLRAVLYSQTGEHEVARALQLEGIALRRRLHHQWSLANGLLVLAEVEIDSGDPSAALPYMSEVLALLGRLDSEFLGLQLIGVTAKWAAEAGAAEIAVVLNAASETQHARMGMVDRANSRELQRFDRVRAKLDDEALDRFQREGRGLDYMDAISRVRTILQDQHVN